MRTAIFPPFFPSRPLFLLQGGELFERIVQRGSLSEAGAARFFRSMVEMVAHVHSLGVMHRDIKPEVSGGLGGPLDALAPAKLTVARGSVRGSHFGCCHHAPLPLFPAPNPPPFQNFLLTDETNGAELKACDFGLAAYVTPGGALADLVGSAYYVAPEASLLSAPAAVAPPAVLPPPAVLCPVCRRARRVTWCSARRGPRPPVAAAGVRRFGGSGCMLCHLPLPGRQAAGALSAAQGRGPRGPARHT